MPNRKKPPRQDGRYEKKIYLGKKDGKRLYKSVYGDTPQEADELAMQVRISLRKGVDVTADRDTFETWANRWLATKERRISAQRYDKYKYCIDVQLARLRYMPISKIGAYDIQDIINEYARESPKTGKPAALKTLKDILSVVRQIFNMAIKSRVVEFNPANAVDIPAEAPEQTRRALTDEEQQWIVDTPHRARRAAMIMMYAGLRRGELIPLTWGDIDLSRKTIDVNKSVAFEKGKPAIRPGRAKSEGSIRTVDIPTVLAEFLKKEKPPSVKPDDLVCTTVTGKLLSDSGWKRMWESYLADLNLKYGDIPEEFRSKHNPHGVPFKIPNITAHWLRHTFITMMYLAGVDVMTAMKQAGHADIKTTLGIYTHLDTKFKRKSMDKLDTYLAKDAPHTQKKKRYRVIKTIR